MNCIKCDQPNYTTGAQCAACNAYAAKDVVVQAVLASQYDTSILLLVAGPYGAGAITREHAAEAFVDGLAFPDDTFEDREAGLLDAVKAPAYALKHLNASVQDLAAAGCCRFVWGDVEDLVINDEVTTTSWVALEQLGRGGEWGHALVEGIEGDDVDWESAAAWRAAEDRLLDRADLARDQVEAARV